MYQCKHCGYRGEELVFQFANYDYCVASNNDEPDFISITPGWVTEMAVGFRVRSELCTPLN